MYTSFFFFIIPKNFNIYDGSVFQPDMKFVLFFHVFFLSIIITLDKLFIFSDYYFVIIVVLMHYLKKKFGENAEKRMAPFNNESRTRKPIEFLTSSSLSRIRSFRRNDRAIFILKKSMPMRGYVQIYARESFCERSSFDEWSIYKNQRIANDLMMLLRFNELLTFQD